MTGASVVEIGHVTERVRVYEDQGGRFHFQAYSAGAVGSRAGPMLCGQSAEDLREAAWFGVGDRRGRVHYDRACAGCRGRLRVERGLGVDFRE